MLKALFLLVGFAHVTLAEDNPFAEMAQTILKEQNAQNIGSLINNFVQSGGAQKVLSNLGENGQLLETLGNLMGSGDNNQNFDPSIITNVVSMLSQATKKQNKLKTQEEPSFDVSSLLSLAGTFLNQQQDSKSDKKNFNMEGLLDYLPLLVNTVNSFAGPEAEKRAESHKSHSKTVPEQAERFHLFIDNLVHSDIGKLILGSLGAEKTIKVFMNEQGKFDYEKMGEMLENHSFRRHWIKMVTERLITFLRFSMEPHIQNRYLLTGQLVFNTYFKTQGFPQKVLFDAKRPSESITAFVNFAAKKYFDVKVDSKVYVKPAMAYLQDINRLVQNKGALLKSEDNRDLSDKLADTINLDLIEPIVRVNRAYNFAKKVPKCDRYVLCLVNEPNPNEEPSSLGFKPLLSKGSSLLASWFLSDFTSTPFWTLYTDIIEDTNCKMFYHEECHDFHVAEEKVTTEYIHNEL